MSHGDGPPPMFDGDDFPYWKVRMEAYLEAVDVGVHKAATQGGSVFAEDPYFEKNNAKAKNILFRGICKDVFNRVRNCKTAHEIWTNFCALQRALNVKEKSAITLSLLS